MEDGSDTVPALQRAAASLVPAGSGSRAEHLEPEKVTLTQREGRPAVHPPRQLRPRTLLALSPPGAFRPSVRLVPSREVPCLPAFFRIRVHRLGRCLVAEERVLRSGPHGRHVGLPHSEVRLLRRGPLCRQSLERPVLTASTGPAPPTRTAPTADRRSAVGSAKSRGADRPTSEQVETSRAGLWAPGVVRSPAELGDRRLMRNAPEQPGRTPRSPRGRVMNPSER